MQAEIWGCLHKFLGAPLKNCARYGRRIKISALLQIVENRFPCVAATRPNTALALWGRARPAGHPAARLAA